jgi:general nucleoside transport system permease protein
MTMIDTPDRAPEVITPADRKRGSARRFLIGGLVLLFLLSLTRVLTDASSLTSSQTMGATLRLAIPIMLAGLAGLWAERVGVLNIGIEGMMIFGAWFGGFGAWQWGAWAGLAFGIVGGMFGGTIHAIATVRFHVDQVISGVAMNLLAFGGMRYMSELMFVGEQGGGISQSPQQTSSIPRVDLPFLGGGDLFGWSTPDILGWIEDKGWFLISDTAGILGALTHNVSLASYIALAMVPLSTWILWRTRFGLRLRSSGEDPWAAESLGVRVQRLRYTGLVISGAFAGFGGAFLSIIASSYYRQGQTANRGFIGLATMIFGNWRPSGVLGGAVLFGFADALQLVGRSALPKLFLFGAFVAGVVLLMSIWRRKTTATAISAIATAILVVAFIAVDEVPEPLTKAAPYLLTLIVLAAASQRLRPPAKAGVQFRPGEGH